MLKKLIAEDLIKSMKEKNQKRVSTLRLINSSIKDLEISLRSQSDSNDINDNDIINILSKMIKQRKESAEIFKKGNREDLYGNEIIEIKIIEEFMPKQLSEDQIISIIDGLILEHDIKDMKGMGIIMGLLKRDYSGQMDLGLASKLIKDKINT
ncbi:MAG: GatB/YqeY domain-containing protein [Pseudomonadota bacterium]|nr:GatB/YqeY domain-containing protein [Pseudomonadota bacterium]